MKEITKNRALISVKNIFLIPGCFGMKMLLFGRIWEMVLLIKVKMYITQDS